MHQNIFTDMSTSEYIVGSSLFSGSFIPSLYIGPIRFSSPFPSGSRSSDLNSALSFRPIRSDLFTKKLPFYSGMGYFVSPTLCWHTFSFSVGSTFVNIFNPFSSIWIFDRTKSFSSTLSLRQWYLLWICLVLEL